MKDTEAERIADRAAEHESDPSPDDIISAAVDAALEDTEHDRLSFAWLRLWRHIEREWYARVYADPRPAPVTEEPPEDDAGWLRLFWRAEEQGWNLKDVAERLGMNYATVCEYSRDLGFSRERRGKRGRRGVVRWAVAEGPCIECHGVHDVEALDDAHRCEGCGGDVGRGHERERAA